MNTSFHDVPLSATFSKNLTGAGINHVLETIVSVLNEDEVTALNLHLEGIAHIEVNEISLKLTLRFRETQISGEDEEVLNHDRLNFTYHLLARIDAIYQLQNTSHTGDFRAYFDLSKYYG